MEKNKLFLLDAMALIYRAHFAFSKNPRITSKGINTGAVLGFTNTLFDIIRKEKPTHLAVAIKYDVDKYSAPVMVAKGSGAIAEKIRSLAEEYDIPIVEDKPLARVLHKTVEVGQLIPASLYKAVAEILAYVYRLKGKGPI